jgi:hypothetical protein
MRQSVYKKTTIEVEGYTAEINVKYICWDRVGGKQSYYTSVSETAKALKAIAKAAGFNVLGCKSKSYSGGDSCDLYVETELTPEQQASNEKNLSHGSRMTYSHPDIYKEPRGELLDRICRHFAQGSFNGMEDIYEYKKGGSTIEDPEGDAVALDTKYCFNHFTTKEEHARWHK